MPKSIQIAMSKEEFTTLIRDAISEEIKSRPSLMEDRLLTIVEASSYLNLSATIIYHLIENGELKSLVFKKQTLFRLQDLNAYKAKEVQDDKSL